MVKKRDWIKKASIILGIIFIIILAITIYLTFIYVPECKNIACWESKLNKCSKASYINDAREIAWIYTIKDKIDNECIVNVKVLEVKKGLANALVLEGKDMDCNLPFGVIISPEANPNLCHGILREEMQNIIIQKLHQYIVQNVGQISKELTSIPGIVQPTSNQTTINSS